MRGVERGEKISEINAVALTGGDCRLQLSEDDRLGMGLKTQTAL